MHVSEGSEVSTDQKPRSPFCCVAIIAAISAENKGAGFQDAIYGGGVNRGMLNADGGVK